MDTTATPATPGVLTSLQPSDASAADIIIKCGGETFPIHKATIWLQSQKLQDACDAAAKVSVTQDSYGSPDPHLTKVKYRTQQFSSKMTPSTRLP